MRIAQVEGRVIVRACPPSGYSRSRVYSRDAQAVVTGKTVKGSHSVLGDAVVLGVLKGHSKGTQVKSDHPSLSSPLGEAHVLQPFMLGTPDTHRRTSSPCGTPAAKWAIPLGTSTTARFRPPVSSAHAHMHARTHAPTHSRTHARPGVQARKWACVYTNASVCSPASNPCTRGTREYP